MVLISKLNNYMFRPKAEIFRLSQLQFCSKSVIYMFIFPSDIEISSSYYVLPVSLSSAYYGRPMDALTTKRNWPPCCSHGTYQHKAITSRSRQFQMMDTWLPETCWATIRREIKNTKFLTTFLQPRHIPTQGYNITQSSAPDDGHMVARNMLSNY